MIEIAGLLASVIIPAIGGIVWLVRLEGRINSNKQTIAEVEKDQNDLRAQVRAELAAITARADAEAAAHSQTTIALVRVQEQLKYLTDMIERLVGSPRARGRQTADQ